MSQQLLKQIEAFRKQRNLPILTLCKMMDVHNVTYHRWRNAGKITGAYKKIVEAFLAKHGSSSGSGSPLLSSQRTSSDIAIIGIACYYPGASNVRELWENILARRVQFRRMLDQRLPLGEYYAEDPKAPEKTYLTKAAFLENFNFDWGRLRIPKKTFESTDIVHWLALDIALKTFEDAGYKPTEIPLQNTGVILGNTLTGEQTRSQTLRLRWPFVQKALSATLGHLGKNQEERDQIASEMEKIYKSAFYPVTEDSLAGGLANTIAGRICNYLNLKGGGYIVDGACSSSLLAVATAADALKMGNMDLALAGGVDISLDPFELVGFAKAGALARDQMRVYDQKANGFLPGEGCGFVLLKRSDDAIRDKNYIYATIKGWGISSDGRGGIMEPSSSGQSYAIGRAYKDLGYKISDVDFVEGHGTGTTKGDRVELEGIATAIDNAIKKGDENKRACGVTSFKSIVGHTKAAAGIGGLIKAVLAVNQRILPPTANCTHPNDVFKDKAKNLYPIIQGRQLPQDQKVRAGISSAGFGGINCHITVESHDDPKQDLKPKIDERALFVSHQETEVFVFTSRTAVHLEKIIAKFKEDLRNISIAEMADLAALLNKKVKNRLPIKAAIVTDSPEHLYDALVLIEEEIQNIQLEEGKIHRIKAKDLATHIILSNGIKKNRIGFLYPGQGSQRLNMTRILVERYGWARDLFSLSKLPLFESIYLAVDKFLTKEEQQEFEKQLSDTRITQPAVVLSSLIWTEFFSKLGIEPQITLGHSLGELTAFYKAGAFSNDTLIKFAEFRGSLMAADSRLSGSMVSLLCSKEKAEAFVEKVSGNLVLANINSPNQIVVSGGKKEIEKVKELAQKENIPSVQLNVSNAFHSSFMKEAADKIQRSKILPYTFKNGDTKVYSCVSGDLFKGAVSLREYFSKQTVSQVNFVKTIEAAASECDLMIELGPGKVLTDLVKAITQEITCLPVESFVGNDRDLNIVLAEIFVRNIPVKWEELYRNRLIKTFVPASRKKFIENQCERPLKIGDQVLKHRFAPVLLQVKEEADQPDQLEDIIPGGLPELEGKDKTADLLLNLTHEITGFEKDSISLNSRLLDDLNLDSIKAAELIGKAARYLGIQGQVDPSQLSNNTLGQIRDRLNELVAVAKAGKAQESVGDILKRYQDKGLVRDFVVNLKPEEIKTKNVNQLKELKNIVLIAEKNEEGLVKTLQNEFKITKAKMQRMYFGESDGKSEKSGPIDCLITILPKNTIDCHSRESGNPNKAFNKESLKSIIERLHQITDLANSKRLDKDSFVVFVQCGGGATSIASTLFLERPDLKVRIIDFDDKIDEEKLSQKIIDELQTYDPFSAVEYDRKLARRVVYYENSFPAAYKKRGISWSNKDIVVVTGGGKGITSQCALEFARFSKARMVLIGRSPIPKNSKDQTNEIVQTLKQFEKEGLKADYYQCDVTDEKDVISTLEVIEKKAGKITGFIHGAGLNSLKRLKQTNVQEAYQESLPKVMGAVNVCRALKDHPPKLIVGITSIIGLTGMEGSGWYGLANETLNLYLHQFKNQNSGTDIVTIAYSVWDEVGMGAKLGSVNRLAEKGIGAIPVKEGIKHFKQLIEGDPDCQQVIVAARIAGIATWKSELKPNNFRFLDKVEYILPCVEIIARANLNIEDDPYLLDHNWKGSLLFPFVFGFEAMAQAVAYVLGIDKFEHIKVKDINLQRPIPVPQESGTTIEIHAQVLEQQKDGKGQVKVDIYSQETAYREPHFSAIFEVDSDVIPAKAGIHNRIDLQIQQKAKNVIDLNMQTDIYAPILFQGKMFQCIERIHELYYEEKTKKGECMLTSVYNKSAEEFLKKNKKFNKKFLIGDPFFIDSLLQSMQLIIPQDICLPRDIEEIELIPVNEKAQIESLTQSTIKRIDPEHYRGDAEVSQDKLSFRIQNCRLKILDTVPGNPSANDLVNPAKRDQKIIENKLKELSLEFELIPPVIKCLYDERLKNASKELRHEIELPLIKEAVKELLNRNNQSVKSFKIKWLKSGKPVVECRGIKDIGISVSHTGIFLMVVAGLGEQGCDSEAFSRKTKNAWAILIGNEKVHLFNEIIQKNQDIDLNFAGMAIWCLSEVATKVGIEGWNNFRSPSYNKDSLIFKSGSDNVIIVFPIISANNKRYLAIFVRIQNVEYIVNDEERRYLKRVSFDKDIFGFDLSYSGPQNQVVFTKRFPVTFRAGQTPSKKVYFTNYFGWMGSIREYSATSIFKEIYVRAEEDSWGMATNYSRLEVFGDVNPGEVVEAKLWTEKSSGIYDEMLNIQFEWAVTNYQGDREIVARSQMGFSWLKILSYGVAKAEPLPRFLKDFFDGMMPKTKYAKSLQEPTKQYKNLNIGDIVFENKDYLHDKSTMFSNEIITTSENSNFIGNIYFANYAEWLGQVSDQYLYRITPKYTTNLGRNGEWVCLNCSIEHLSEAMPYDKILINMNIKTVYTSGLDLFFNYYLLENGAIKRKLAYASHKIISVKRDLDNLIVLKLPNDILEKFFKKGVVKS